MADNNIAGPARKARIQVFVSYAREDASLVRDITDELKQPFSFLLDFFVDSQTIRQGANWREVINDRLDSADVLLMISTGQPKESFEFPGYEIGYFSRSIKGRSPRDGTGRQVIPLVIGGATPSAVLDIQGVIIKPEDVLSVVPGDLASEDKFLERLGEDNPFRKMLRQLRDVVTTMADIKLSDDDLRVLDKNINDCASRLYRKAFAYLQDRVYSESYPERKIIIRTALPPLPSDEEAVLAGSTIEFVGKSFELFSLSERPRQLTWPTFIAAIRRADIAMQWREGIRTLVSRALSGMTSDNYYFVSSLKAEHSFRLFVSLTRTYFSGQKEIHIYIVEKIALKDYGDLKTTKLMKAVAVGLRYRSLFLEQDSPFSPGIVGYSVANLRQKVTELWTELQFVIAEARQDRLDDPQLLFFIYGAAGHEKLDKLAAVWHEHMENLNRTTHEILAADDDKADKMKEAFIAVLKQFCDKTEEMNREFTAKALQALEAEITLKLATPASDMGGPPKAAAA